MHGIGMFYSSTTPPYLTQQNTHLDGEISNYGNVKIVIKQP